jgi:hypothetical protein
MPGLSRDLDQMIVEKAAQIGKYIVDLEMGRHALSKGATLALPVVITGQEVPGMLGLSSMIREKVDCAKPFENVKMDVLPVTYMSIDELESLAITFNGKLDLRTFIEKKQQHADPIARASSIRNYLYYYCSESRLPEGATPRSLPARTDTSNASLSIHWQNGGCTQKTVTRSRPPQIAAISMTLELLRYRRQTISRNRIYQK